MENNSLLLCETASVSELTSRAVRAVVNGDIDPITAHINISRMEAAIKAFKDNVRISLLNTRLTIRALVPVPFRQHNVDEQGRISLLRPMDSLRRLLADRATPWQLGRSAAVAIAVSTLPLPGLQSILLLLCIGWLRLNRLCALAMIPLTRSVFWGPMAVSIMGGLIVATLLTVFFLPALYAAWYRVKIA